MVACLDSWLATPCSSRVDWRNFHALFAHEVFMSSAQATLTPLRHTQRRTEVTNGTHGAKNTACWHHASEKWMLYEKNALARVYFFHHARGVFLDFHWYLLLLFLPHTIPGSFFHFQLFVFCWSSPAFSIVVCLFHPFRSCCFPTVCHHRSQSSVSILPAVSLGSSVRFTGSRAEDKRHVRPRRGFRAQELWAGACLSLLGVSHFSLATTWMNDCRGCLCSQWTNRNMGGIQKETHPTNPMRSWLGWDREGVVLSVGLLT